MIEEITIKIGMELKPTKARWKSQLYKKQWKEPFSGGCNHTEL